MRDRSYQGLKDATSFGLICDKSAEILGWKYSNFYQFPIQPFLAFFFLLLCVHWYANEAVTSLPVEICVEGDGELVPIFRIFGLKLLSAFSRLYSKRGGIL